DRGGGAGAGGVRGVRERAERTRGGGQGAGGRERGAVPGRAVGDEHRARAAAGGDGELCARGQADLGRARGGAKRPVVLGVVGAVLADAHAGDAGGPPARGAVRGGGIGREDRGDVLGG